MLRAGLSVFGFLVFMVGSLRALPPEGNAFPSASSIAQHAIKLAETRHCAEALPFLKKSLARVVDKQLKRSVGLDGVRCAMSLNQPDAALAFLQVITRDFPQDPEVLYLAVHTYSDLSTRAAQELATRAPNSPQAHELNAEALEMQGKWDEAAKEYQAIQHREPRLPGIHFRLGRLILSRPNPPTDMVEQARKEFQQELEIDPNDAGAEYVLGELARQESQWSEAIAHFSKATKLDTTFGDAFLGLGTSLLSSKQFSQAIPPLETAVKLEPQNPAAHYSLAMAYSRAGRARDAEREFAVHKQMTQKGDDKSQAEAPPGSPN
ncbi:MAG TPA: tetratricopeptide repeat protein [Terriglobales bacterium]|nr:tetratricopeptide repeat protein [Terriglobales bacterium]